MSNTKKDKAFNDFISEVRLYADAMFENVRMGDDGWKEAHEKCYKQLRQVLAEYVMSRQPKPAEPIEGKNYVSYKEYDYHTSDDKSTVKQWQQKLYAYLKRRINADEQLSEVGSSELRDYIEAKYICDSEDTTLKDNFYNILMYASFDVLVDIERELIEFRKNNSQQKLFEE